MKTFDSGGAEKTSSVPPDNSITEAMLQDDAVGPQHIQDDSIGTIHIQDEAVGAAEIAPGVITDAHVAAANKDGVAGTASLRTLGTGAAQACAGNDARLSNDRTASGLRSATTVVAVSGATAPSPGQILTAVDAQNANWQTPAASGGPVSVAATTADVSNSTTTGAKITELDKTLAAGTYAFQYFVRAQSAATGTGHKFGVNFSGTHSVFVANMAVVGTGTAASTGTADGENTADQIMEGYGARTESSTSPNLGPTLGVDTANADIFYLISGIIVVTASGDLQLYHASEVAAQSTVMTGTSVIVTKTG